jgi:hypothetical protein
MQDCKVCIVTTLGAKRPRNRDSSPGTSRKLFLPEEVKSDSGTHIQDHYSIQPSCVSRGITRLGREADKSPRLQFGVAKHSHMHMTSLRAQEKLSGRTLTSFCVM